MNFKGKLALCFLLILFFFHSCNIDSSHEDTDNLNPGENQIATLVMNPAGGTYDTDQSVVITCGTTGAAIHYTTDGSEPDSGSPVYSTPVSVSGNGTTMTIRAYATKAGMSDSAVQSEVYIINYSKVSTPAMSPIGGTYNSDQSVTITCPTSGATIYYTTDGSDPDEGSTEYTAPVSVAGHGTNMTIKAIAMIGGMLDSAIANQEYTINYNQVSTPSMSPVGGTFNSDLSVAITCTTAGATIYYTIDGSDPHGRGGNSRIITHP